jgi:hypothetical protein
MDENKSVSEGMKDSITPKEEEQEATGTFLPRILDMHVIHGLGADKKPDPHKILFYHDTVGDKYYDCESHEWCDEKPMVVDHLHNRPIIYNDQDIVAAIAHGVMDDNDYEALDKSSLLGELPKRLWGHIKNLKDLVEQQEKMAKSEEEEVGSEMSSDPALGAEGYDPQGESSSDDLLDDIDADEMPGENVIQMIMAQALSKADDRLREIVREEIAKLLSGDDESSEQEQPMEEPMEDQETTEFFTPETDELD